MPNLAYTWLGHATFLIASPGGKKVLIDPWVTGNPMSPDSAKNIGHVDLVLVTHGHGDHMGDVVPIARAAGAPVVAPYELARFFSGRGCSRSRA